MKIVLFSDSPWVMSGQARVVRSLGRIWKKKHEVVSIAWNIGDIPDSMPEEWTTYQAKEFYGLETDHGVAELVKGLLTLKPDLIFCLGDPFHFKRLKMVKDEMAANEQHPFFLGYLNVDGYDLPYHYSTYLSGFDSILATSEHAATELQKITSKHVRFVHHGVDRSKFKPLTNLRQDSPLPIGTLFEDAAKSSRTWDDYFILTYVGRNSIRKSLGTLLEAVGMVHKDCPDLRLLLVTEPEDPHGIPLYDVATRYGVIHKSATLRSNFAMHLPEEKLNEVYNHSEAVILTSQGEGFGLSVIEAMAAGTPVIAPASSATKELIDGRGILIPVSGEVWAPQAYKLRTVTAADTATAIRLLYDDWKRGGAIAKTIKIEGLRFANSKSWQDLATALLDEVKQVPVRVSPTTLGVRSDDTGIRNLLNVVSTIPHEKRLFVTKFGGLGDQVQLIPVLKGIRKKHPDHKIVLLVESDYGLFEEADYIDLWLVVGGQSVNTFVKALLPHCDIIYDVRYVSRVHGLADYKEDKLNWFYTFFPFSSNRLSDLGQHVIDLMIDSLHLRDYCSINDLSVDILPHHLVDKLPSKYIVVHNAAGNVGQLKNLPSSVINSVVKELRSSYTVIVQAGLTEDELIPGAIDLRGQLPARSVAYLLQKATLYVGTEGGYFHLAKAVGTPAVIYTSITPPICFAYSDTYVATQEKCNPCWWRGSDWHTYCPLDFKSCVNFPTKEQLLETINTALEIHARPTDIGNPNRKPDPTRLATDCW